MKIDENIKNNFIKKGLKITIGGDSRYGLGLMELINVEEKNIQNTELFNKLKKANYLFVKDNQSKNVPIELLVEAIGYEGSNLKIKEPKYCYIPGHQQENNNLELKKGVL